jgi:hypothetical protein
METQQLIGMLAEMREKMETKLDANTKATLATQVKMNETTEDMKTMQENIQENLKKTMEEIMNTNQAKTDVKLEELGEAIEKTHVEREEPTSADMNACQDVMEANLVKIEPTPGEKEAAVERQETPNEDVAIYSLRECRKETMACQGTTEARLESESEHREVPNEDAVVKPVRGRKKRQRGRKQAAGQHGELKELIRGDCGSRKKLAAACREVSHSATVAWRKRNIFRKSLTQRNCGPRKEVTAAEMKVTRCPGHRRKEQNKDDVAPGSQRGGTFDRRLWRSPECKKGIRSGVVEEPLHLRKGRKTVNSNEGWSRRHHPRLEIMGNAIQSFGKAIERQFGKLADGSSVVLRDINNWTLWRVRPPSKVEKEAVLA